MAKKKIDLGYTPSTYQQNVFDFVQHGTGNAVISALAGSGKCLGRDTEILMYDGSIKKVQDIQAGDLLMGDDSNPRRVLSTTKGYGKLKKIVPKKGNSWICNDVHVLTLDFYNTSSKGHGHYETIDVSIEEINKQKKYNNKHKDGDYRNLKLLKTGVEFRHQDVDFDPWLYGMWLGDGTSGEASITNPEPIIIDEIKRRSPKDTIVKVSIYKNKCPKINIKTQEHKRNSNKIRQFFRNSSDVNGKFIDKKYLINDRHIRLNLLAGLMDSDGYYSNGNYYISTKSKRLCEDILFLTRSLGFGAYAVKRNKTCHNNGVTKPYYHITINGELTEIPVVTERRKAKKRIINKNPLHVGFRIDDNGEGEYYGFTLDGNGRFLLSDFTITHNTTTIVTCMKLVPKTQKCLFLAFNKSIVNTLQEKVKNYSNCYVKTMHSLGFAILRRNLGDNIEKNDYKYRSYIKSNINELTSIQDEHLTTSQVNEYIDSITKLVDFARFNLAQSENDIEKIARKYDIPINFDEASVVKKVLKWGKENTNVIDYTDMVWLPVELSLRPIGLQYDWIFADEVQDFSLVYNQLMFKCFKRGTRFICVGDERQSINVFAGSSPEAFQYLCNYPNTHVFELPITYRCPTSVVDMAKEYVGNIQAREDAPDGEIRYDCKIKDLKDGDMVLARTKAPLLKLYTKLLRKKVQCYIKGSDIGLNLIKMLENIDKEELNQDLTKDGVFVRLFDNLFTERNKLMRNYGLSKDDATLTSNIMERYDLINSLLTLSERLTTKTKLIKNIENIFKEENNGIILSTIHKAKGLEADNVYILCRSSMPSKLAHSDWERQQEENLIYVAITRPKQILGFISEKEIPASGSAQDPLVILNDLRGIEKQVCSILGKEPVPEDDNIELTKMRVKNATKIDEHSSELPQNTVKLNETKHIKPDDKLLDMLSSYLGNGGDMESLSKFLGK